MQNVWSSRLPQDLRSGSRPVLAVDVAMRTLKARISKVSAHLCGNDCFLALLSFCAFCSEQAMAWPNPLRRKTPLTRSAWGFVFELTPLHPTLEDTGPLKHSYDALGEEAYLRLTDIRESDKAQQQSENGHSEPAQKTSAPAKKDDLYVLLRDNAGLDPKLGQLWREMDQVPSWVDWEQISRGQDCFYRYGYASYVFPFSRHLADDVEARTSGRQCVSAPQCTGLMGLWSKSC